MNDPSRDVDRLDIHETIHPLGQSTSMLRLAEVPTYLELVSLAFEKLGADRRDLKGYRTRIDYPLYGSQVAIAFDASPLEPSSP